MNHILVYCVLIKSLESLVQATAQRCITIWNIRVLHGSVLTQIR